MRGMAGGMPVRRAHRFDAAMTSAVAPGGQPWCPSDFERIYVGNVRDIRLYVARRVGPGPADDLTSQVFTEAWHHKERFDPSLGSERAWIFGIAGNVVRRHLRVEGSNDRALARLRGRPTLVIGEDEDVIARVDASSGAASVVVAFGRLDDVDQEIVWLAGSTDLSMEEIASVLEMPVGTVKSRLSRARKRLRTDLAASQGVDGRE